MPIVEVEPGVFVAYPDLPDPKEETLGDKVKIGLKGGVKLLKDSLVSGLAGIPQAYGGAMANLPPLGGLAIPKALGMVGQAAAQKFEKENSDLGDYPYLRAGVQGAFMGATGSPTKALIPAAGVAGTAGGLGAEAGHTLTKGTGFETLAGLLGGGLAGGLTGAALGPRQSVAQSDIWREAQHLSPADFAKAAGRRAEFDATGAPLTSVTLADLFDPGKGVVGLAERTANSVGGEALKNKLAGRPADIVTLGEKYKSNIGGPVDTSVVANRVADAANGALEGAIRQVKDGLRNRLAGKMLTPEQAQAFRYNMYHLAQLETEPLARKAYLDLAKEFSDVNGLPLASVQKLSLRLKSMEDSIANPLDITRGASQIDRNMALPALRAAETKLGEFSPSFAQGMEDFSAGMASVNTLKEGPLGRLVDANPNIARPTPLARLESVLSGNEPRTVAGTARVLDNPALTDPSGAGMNGYTVSPREIANALVRERMAQGKVSPAQDPNWLGSLDNRRIDALLEAGGLNPAQVNLPLKAADQLKGLDIARGSSGIPRMSFTQALIRPFRTLDMMLTAHNQEGVNREVARLMMDPKNLEQLQKIAQFDPAVRKALTLSSAVLPTLSTGLARSDN